MKGNIHIYNSSDVGTDTGGENPNGKVNYEKLDVEILTSLITNYVKCFTYGSLTFVEFEPLAIPFDETARAEFETNKLLLDEIMTKHDGKEASVTRSKIDERYLQFNKLVQMAHYLPTLTDKDQISGYLAHIDDEKNAFCTDGNPNVLNALITSEALDTGNEFYGFLNTVVGPPIPPSVDPVLAYQFLISQITEISQTV